MMNGCVPNLNIDNACEYHPIYLRQFKTGFHQWRANRTDTCMYREDVGLGSDSPKKNLFMLYSHWKVRRTAGREGCCLLGWPTGYGRLDHTNPRKHDIEASQRLVPPPVSPSQT